MCPQNLENMIIGTSELQLSICENRIWKFHLVRQLCFIKSCVLENRICGSWTLTTRPELHFQHFFTFFFLFWSSRWGQQEHYFQFPKKFEIFFRPIFLTWSRITFSEPKILGMFHSRNFSPERELSNGVSLVFGDPTFDSRNRLWMCRIGYTGQWSHFQWPLRSRERFLLISKEVRKDQMLIGRELATESM